VVALAGCGGRREAPAAGGADSTVAPGPAANGNPVPEEGRERSQAFIDAGNEAYRAADYELALKRYAAAAVADPRDPAAYFGMGMTFTRLKREDEARAAFARAQALSRETPSGP